MIRLRRRGRSRHRNPAGPTPERGRPCPDPTDPADAADPTDPADAADPTDPADAADAPSADRNAPAVADAASRLGSPRLLTSTNLRLLVFVTVVVLLVGAGVALLRSSQDPTVGELRSAAEWDDLRTLKVGVAGDVPYVSEWHEDGTYTGFDVDVAYLVADWLRVPRHKVSFYEVTPENRHRMVGVEHEKSTFVSLDLVVSSYSITPDRQLDRHVVFAGPYLRTEPTVMTRIGSHASPIESLSALDTPLAPGGPPQRVCVPGASTSAEYVRREAPNARVTLLQRNGECVRLLREGKMDAAVTDAAILGGFAVRYRTELKLHNISSTDDEFWGIGVGIDRTGNDPRIQARQQLVLLALHDLLISTGQNGWKEAFNRNLQPMQAAVVPAPGEYPQLIADDRQPTPEGLRPVRRWPWDRSG
jgi:glutamate transport system substrate-binding protein